MIFASEVLVPALTPGFDSAAIARGLPKGPRVRLPKLRKGTGKPPARTEYENFGEGGAETAEPAFRTPNRRGKMSESAEALEQGALSKNEPKKPNSLRSTAEELSRRGVDVEVRGEKEGLVGEITFRTESHGVVAAESKRLTSI